MNLNDVVKVKLTAYGEDILKSRHDALYTSLPVGNREFKLVVDKDGYYSTQLRFLMEDFGEYMSLGGKLPFETEILLNNEKDLEEENARLKKALKMTKARVDNLASESAYIRDELYQIKEIERLNNGGW